MLSNYIEQLFKLDNYYDGLIVTDNKGYIEFFMTYRPDISGAKQEDLVGKHVLDIYPGLTEETSTIMRVLRSGEPIYNEYQTLITCREEVFQSVNTTMPIRAGGTGEIIGAIDVSRYASRFYEKQSINLHSAHTRKGPFYCVDDIITWSEDMEAIKRKIPLISKTDSTVLITGRSGTGKELIAQSIHTSSNRADKAFVSQNCAAIPATLLESILFGTTKGSYTGAENKPGLFEIANGGTLFLDEINSMDISVQPKLLRAIEEKRVCRLGSYKPLEVDVKIVAAMNEDPQECVRKGKLREDLLYRLSVVRVDMPTLQERRCDIELLMKYFISKFNSSMKKDIFGVDEEVKKMFEEYPWPGNVRELRNTIEGAFNVAQGKCIHARDLTGYIVQQCGQHEKDSLPCSTGADEGPSGLNDQIHSVEKRIIEDALKKTSTYAEAARLIGISRQAFMYKMKKYKIDV